MNKDDIRTSKVTVWWRWWDEAEHKSSPDKRLAFYDALFRYAFRGDVPDDPLETGEKDGVAWAAYDASHHFDVIDNEVSPPNLGGAPFGNRNAAKRQPEKQLIKQPQKQPVKQPIKQPSKQPKNNLENNQENNPKTTSFLNNEYMNTEDKKEENNNAGSEAPVVVSSDMSSKVRFKRGEKALCVGMFEAFWDRYPGPRKVDKKKCHDKWEIIFRGVEDPKALFYKILAGLDVWKRSKMWTSDDGKYIKSPLVWLNGRNWEDEPEGEIAPEAPPKPVEVSAEDWTLCRERCANCSQAGCTRGMSTPPQMREWPIPPEQCGGFVPIKAEKSGKIEGNAKITQETMI